MMNMDEIFEEQLENISKGGKVKNEYYENQLLNIRLKLEKIREEKMEFLGS